MLLVARLALVEPGIGMTCCQRFARARRTNLVRDLQQVRETKLSGFASSFFGELLLRRVSLRASQSTSNTDNLVNQFEVVVKGLALETRHVRSVAILLNVLRLLELVSQEAAAKWRVANDGKVELLGKGEHLADLRLHRPQREFNLHGSDWVDLLDQ